MTPFNKIYNMMEPYIVICIGNKMYNLKDALRLSNVYMDIKNALNDICASYEEEANYRKFVVINPITKYKLRTRKGRNWFLAYVMLEDNIKLFIAAYSAYSKPHQHKMKYKLVKYDRACRKIHFEKPGKYRYCSWIAILKATSNEYAFYYNVYKNEVVIDSFSGGC